MSTPDTRFDPARFGAFPLTDVHGLPNASVAFPGEHWSDGKAVEVITPGECVVPVGSAGVLGVKRATVAESKTRRAGVALWTVQIPDTNPGNYYHEVLGPNQIMNRDIPVGEYVHRWVSGAFWLSLCVPDTSYAPGDLVGWDPAGNRPASKGGAGKGAWKKVAAEADAVFELQEFQQLNALGEGLIRVRSLQGQF